VRLVGKAGRIRGGTRLARVSWRIRHSVRTGASNMP